MLVLVQANMEISNSHNVLIYSFKSEGEWRDLSLHGGTHSPCVAVWIDNSTNVRVFSHGGNARPVRGKVLVPVFCGAHS